MGSLVVSELVLQLPVLLLQLPGAFEGGVPLGGESYDQFLQLPDAVVGLQSSTTTM
jgi:hypothetical protein